MSANDWPEIPGRLTQAGFAIFYERISFEPDYPLWCAKAARGDRQWITSGATLKSALIELENRIHAGGEGSRERIEDRTLGKISGAAAS